MTDKVKIFPKNLESLPQVDASQAESASSKLPNSKFSWPKWKMPSVWTTLKVSAVTSALAAVGRWHSETIRQTNEQIQEKLIIDSDGTSHEQQIIGPELRRLQQQEVD